MKIHLFTILYLRSVYFISTINYVLHNDRGCETQWKLNTVCEPQQNATRSFIILTWFIFHAAALLVTRKVRILKNHRYIFPHTAAKDKVISSGEDKTALEIRLCGSEGAQGA